MNLEQRIELLLRLGKYMVSADPAWQGIKERAGYENGWFIPGFVDVAVRNIADNFLNKNVLEKWAADYQLPLMNKEPRLVGIVMAGNIPLVGFHDLLCVFTCGHKAIIKLSSRDSVLTQHLVEKMSEWDPEIKDLVEFSEQLKNCDAYIATGSNNSAGYFEYYFRKYPHIIRRNRTSVALLTGHETATELEKLADDVHLYFGLGCRNVTKIFAPMGYDFPPLLQAFKKYKFLFDHHKYRNNYDYNLAILLLNKKFYMSSGSLLLVEDKSVFSPISQLNYEFYQQVDGAIDSVLNSNDIQCLVGTGYVAFGEAQCPSITDYADRADTMQFLVNL